MSSSEDAEVCGITLSLASQSIVSEGKKVGFTLTSGPRRWQVQKPLVITLLKDDKEHPIPSEITFGVISARTNEDLKLCSLCSSKGSSTSVFKVRELTATENTYNLELYCKGKGCPCTVKTPASVKLIAELKYPSEEPVTIASGAISIFLPEQDESPQGNTFPLVREEKSEREGSPGQKRKRDSPDSHPNKKQKSDNVGNSPSAAQEQEPVQRQEAQQAVEQKEAEQMEAVQPQTRDVKQEARGQPPPQDSDFASSIPEFGDEAEIDSESEEETPVMEDLPPPPPLPKTLEAACDENPFYKPTSLGSYLASFHFCKTSPKTVKFDLTPENLQIHNLDPSSTCVILRCFPYQDQEPPQRWLHKWPRRCLVQVNSSFFLTDKENGVCEAEKGRRRRGWRFFDSLSDVLRSPGNVTSACTLGTNTIRIYHRPDPRSPDVNYIAVLQLMKVYSVDDCISQFLPTADEPFRRQLDKNKGKEFLRNFFAANKREFQPISLLDPLSGHRVQIPCRGTSCQHLDCFDLNTWLDHAKQISEFECSVCQSPLLFEELVIDTAFLEILDQVPAAISHVNLYPSGKWSLLAQAVAVDLGDDDIPPPPPTRARHAPSKARGERARAPRAAPEPSGRRYNTRRKATSLVNIKTYTEEDQKEISEGEEPSSSLEGEEEQ